MVALPAIQLVEDQAREKNIEIHRDFPQGAINGSFDPDLMKIVAVNFLSNAVKYSDPGGRVDVAVSLRGENIRFSVKNTGPGFSEEQKGALFRRFSRIKSTELMKRKGSGVGLYTSARIVREHGGRVGADSQPGEWALFWFEIPKNRPDGPATST